MSTMTGAVDPGPAESGASPGSRRLRRPGLSGLWLLGVFLLTVGVRAFGNARGYDVFVDEVTYLRVSESVANDLSVRLYGEAFFLHPPAFFLVEAGWLRAFGLPGDVVDAVLLSRVLVWLLAGITAVLAVRLVASLAGRRAAAAAGLFVVLDPFLIRINSRNLLETQTLLLVLAGISLLVVAVSRGHLSGRRAATAGLLLGLGVLTKDTAAIVVAPPLLFLLARRETRTAALTCGLAIVATYLPYPVVAAVSGNWQAFYDEKVVGVLRLSGQVQLTGFNAPGSSSFADRVVERLSFYGASYALMAVGVAAAAHLIVRGDVAGRVLGWWSTGAYLLAAYSIVRGTLEEQLFYFVLLPAAVVVPVSAARWWQDRAVGRVAARGPAPSAARTVAMVLVALWGVAAVTSYVEVHTTRDDAYARMVDYVDTRLRFDGTPRIGVTSDPASVLLKGSEIFRVGTAADARRDRVDFVLVSSSAVRNGTAEVSPSLLRLIEEGSLVHRVRGRSVEELDLYRVATPPG